VGVNGQELPVVFLDMAGIEINGKIPSITEIDMALQGNLPIGYKVNFAK
jgi:hypothetical protein